MRSLALMKIRKGYNMTKNEIKETIQTLIEKHAISTMVSSNQTGLQSNQLRVYREDDQREYFIITIKKEKL
jgi:hypothetical protein